MVLRTCFCPHINALVRVPLLGFPVSSAVRLVELSALLSLLVDLQIIGWPAQLLGGAAPVALVPIALAVASLRPKRLNGGGLSSSGRRGRPGRRRAGEAPGRRHGRRGRRDLRHQELGARGHRGHRGLVGAAHGVPEVRARIPHQGARGRRLRGRGGAAAAVRGRGQGRRTGQDGGRGQGQEGHRGGQGHGRGRGGQGHGPGQGGSGRVR
mmetsp:Transcript_90780/g.255923  ORF Transcript_90780/g.255923 Transcript_90780/m.255923 type:complete len:210 (+) Transcript_90780:1427-2056(+)